MPEQTVLSQQAEQNTGAESLPSNEAGDLTSRVSEVSLENPASEQKQFNRNEFNEKLASLPPEMQEQVRLFQQSIYKGADEKFQEAARLRNEAESLRQRGWDKESVQSLLNDPTFVANVQQLQAEREAQNPPEGTGISSEAWSYLTPEEKQALRDTQKKASQADQKISQFIAQQEHQRQHEQLKSRYKNYNPDAVNEIYNGLITGKVQANLEHLWKALDYEAAIKRSYELGRKEQNGAVSEKMASSTPGIGMNVNQNYQVPAKEKTLSGPEYFKQLAFKRMKQMGVTDMFKK